MKKYIISIMMILMLCLTACTDTLAPSGNPADDDLNSYENNDVMHEEEFEGAELSFKNTEKDNFIGTWFADSAQAEYLYGNVELSIKKGGVWTGVITDEKLTGTWQYKDGSLYLHNELIDLKLSFTKDNTLIMQEVRDDEGEPINTVLKKKGSL